jgi:hypothetical protein
MRKNKIVCGIDIGLKGALFFIELDTGMIVNLKDMPTYKDMQSAAKYKYKYKDPSKVYKSGPRKGERPRIMVRKAKYKTKLSISKLRALLEKYRVDYIGVETIFVQNAYHAKTAYINQGVVWGLAAGLNIRYIEFAPQKWQNFFDIHSKEDSIDEASKFLPIMRHDEADAVNIGRYTRNLILEENQHAKEKIESYFNEDKHN